MDADLLEKYSIFPVQELVNWMPMQMANNTKRVLLDAFFTYFGRKFEVVKWLQAKRRKPQPLLKCSIPEAIKVATPLFLKNIRTIGRLSKGLDFTHFQFLQPNFYRKRKLTQGEALAIDLYENYRPVLGGKKTAEYLANNNIYQGVLEVTAGEAAYGSVTDLSDIFLDEKETMYYSPVHCTDEGYNKIAEQMYLVITQDQARKT